MPSYGKKKETSKQKRERDAKEKKAREEETMQVPEEPRTQAQAGINTRRIHARYFKHALSSPLSPPFGRRSLEIVRAMLAVQLAKGSKTVLL
jgi:hypothetical protein